MSRISSAFAHAGRTALIPYVTVGYPSVEATLAVVPRLVESGCDMVELGIPFSDPLADGPVIQNASHHALRNGVTLETCLEVAAELSRQVDVPLVFMTYYNPVFHYGLERFCTASAKAGVAGLIVPDLPPEEGAALEAASRMQDLDLIYLVAPSSSDKRIELIARRSRGFLYLVSVAGTTGARGALPPTLPSFVARVRERSRLPLCVGFGIATPAQAAEVAALADGVIVGSRIVQLMASADGLEAVASFTGAVRAALDETSRKTSPEGRGWR